MEINFVIAVWVTIVGSIARCVAAAETKEELVKLIREAIESHIEGLRADNMPVPKPSRGVEFVEVAA